MDYYDCLCGALESVRFLDAIRIPDTNVYVINFLCVSPMVYEPSVVQPDVTTEIAPSEEEDQDEGEEETAAHMDGMLRGDQTKRQRS